MMGLNDVVFLGHHKYCLQSGTQLLLHTLLYSIRAEVLFSSGTKALFGSVVETPTTKLSGKLHGNRYVRIDSIDKGKLPKQAEGTYHTILECSTPCPVLVF